MKSTDVVASFLIGVIAALLMFAVSRSLPLPAAANPYFAPLLVAFPLATLATIAVGTFLRRHVCIFYELAKFGLVGGSNFLVNLGVLNFLIALTHIPRGVHANVFKVTSFLVAVTRRFFWNKLWTFGSVSTSWAGRQFVEFFIVSVVGLIINVGSFDAINNGIRSPDGIPPRTWANIAAGGAAVVSALWNFFGYKFVVFRRRIL